MIRSSINHAVPDFEVLIIVLHIALFRECRPNRLEVLENWVTLPLTREIVLSDDYLSQFFPHCKVLWLTSKQRFKIVVKLPLFDCSGAICNMYMGQHQVLVPSA